MSTAEITAEKFKEIWLKTFPNEEEYIPEAMWDDLKNCGFIILLKGD